MSQASIGASAALAASPAPSAYVRSWCHMFMLAASASGMIYGRIRVRKPDQPATRLRRGDQGMARHGTANEPALESAVCGTSPPPTSQRCHRSEAFRAKRVHKLAVECGHARDFPSPVQCRIRRPGGVPSLGPAGQWAGPDRDHFGTPSAS
jgi:hypothetical protein